MFTAVSNQPPASASLQPDGSSACHTASSVRQSPQAAHILPRDSVWLFSPAVPPGTSLKFHRYRQGPFTVQRRVYDHDYAICNAADPTKVKIIHHDRLKPCLLLDIEPPPSPPFTPTTPPLSSNQPPGTLAHPSWSLDDDDLPSDVLPPPLQPQPPPGYHINILEAFLGPSMRPSPLMAKRNPIKGQCMHM